MAQKAIVDIEINDGPFRDFYEMFQKYQKQLEGMPEDWKKVVDVIDGAGGEMDHFSSSAMSSKDFLKIAAIQADAISKAMARSTGAQDKFNTKAKDGAIQMGRMAKFSKEMQKDLVGMSGLSTKMMAFGVGGLAVGAVVGAIAGAIKAVYGATSTVAGQNLDAKSLSLNIGQTQAFDANFKKYGIDSSALGNVQSMIGRPETWGTLSMAGVNPTTAQNQPLDQTAFKILESESSQVRQWKASGQNAALLFGSRFPNSPFSFQQALAAANYAPGDVASSWAKEQVDAKNNFISQSKGDTAADAMAKLQADHDKVMNSFNSALVNATPALTAVANAAADLAFWMSGGSDAKSSSFSDTANTKAALRSGVSPGDIGQGHVAEGAIIAGGGVSGMSSDPVTAMMAAQLKMESGGVNGLTSKKGAKGLYQFMDDTWKQFGHGDQMDPVENAAAARRYDTYLLKYYSGDVEKALAAYNYGMGKVDKDINGYTDRQGSVHQGHGANWKNFLPKETSNYVKNGVNIMITNSTTANVATSTNAAGH